MTAGDEWECNVQFCTPENRLNEVRVSCEFELVIRKLHKSNVIQHSVRLIAFKLVESRLYPSPGKIPGKN